MGGRAIESGNLLAHLAAQAADEQVQVLVETAGVRIERIVSTGQASPPGFWYDQDRAEFVVLVAGAADLSIAGETQARSLSPGDWLHLPARCRHRVERTASDRPTVWLAIHHGPQRDIPPAGG